MGHLAGKTQTTLVTAVVLALWSAAPTVTPVRAQTMEPMEAPVCQGGRVADSGTRGRCCWPGQVWSPEAGRCAGPPTCPSGLAAQGDDCVRTSGSAPTAPAPYATPVVVVPQSPPLPPPMPEPSEDESRPTMGLIIPGAIMFGVSYVITAALAGLVAEVSPEDNDGLVNLIPVAGPWVCLATCDFSSGEKVWRTPLIIDGVLQTAGVTMFILGFVLRRDVRRPRASTLEGPSWAFAPWIGSGIAGIQWVGSGF